MALHIIPEDLDIPIPQAEVVSTPLKGFKALFHRGEGSVCTVPAELPGYTRIRVIPPAWHGGQKDEADILRNCYQEILQAAAQAHCTTLALRLITENVRRFPAHLDFKIAVEEIQAFLACRDMRVYLILPLQDRMQISQLRADVEGFLAGHYTGSLSGDTIPLPLIPEDLPDECSDFFLEECCAPSAPAEGIPEPMPPLRAKKASRSAVSPTVKPKPMAASSRFDREKLEAMIRATDAGFSETLLRLIDKSGKKDSEIYTRANVSRQHFSKIRNNPGYKPTKPTAIAFAIALELDLEQTRDLIGRAGYALTNSSKFDVIIMYFIGKKHYNMMEINETLYEFD